MLNEKFPITPVCYTTQFSVFSISVYVVCISVNVIYISVYDYVIHFHKCVIYTYVYDYDTQISTDDTSILASNPQYMVRLIEITRNKMKSLTTDRTMRFALSALWNLTDESPKACHCFFKLHGLELAIECLKVSLR